MRDDWKCPCCGDKREDSGEMFDGLEDSIVLWCENCDANYVVYRTCVFYYNPEPFTKVHLLRELKYYEIHSDGWMDMHQICLRSDLGEERFVMPLLEQLIADGSVEQRGDGEDRQYRLKP